MAAQSQRLHDRIRYILETEPGLTQRGLAECMGLNPAAINRMLHGRRNIMAEEISIIEAYLGRKLDIHAATSQPRQKARGFSDTPQQSILGQPQAASGFAVYVSSDDMSPRYFKGEMVFVSPQAPVEEGRDILIEKKNGTVVVRRLVKISEEKIRVQQFNPAGQKDIQRREIKAIHAVTGRG